MPSSLMSGQNVLEAAIEQQTEDEQQRGTSKDAADTPSLLPPSRAMSFDNENTIEMPVTKIKSGKMKSQNRNPSHAACW